MAEKHVLHARFVNQCRALRILLFITSLLDAALEILWFNNIVVVVSAGNNGTSGIVYPPANDSFVITVGAADDRGTPDAADDILVSYSAYGTTESGFAKPDLVAPGTDIVSVLASRGAALTREHPDHIVRTSRSPGAHFRVSGTSMASAVVAGAAALLIQDEPDLNPDQVKHRLMATARPSGTGAGAGMVDIYSAGHGTTTETANTGTEASRLGRRATAEVPPSNQTRRADFTRSVPVVLSGCDRRTIRTTEWQPRVCLRARAISTTLYPILIVRAARATNGGGGGFAQRQHVARGEAARKPPHTPGFWRHS